MRIQGVSKNNYQSNYPKRDIGFKLNSIVIVEGFNQDYGKIGETTNKALHKAIFEPILRGGRIRLGQKFKVVQDERDLSKFWILDPETMEKVRQVQTNADEYNLWKEITEGIKTFRVNWRNKQPTYLEN